MLLTMSLALCLISAVTLSASAQSFESWSAKAEKAQKHGETALAIEYLGNALRIWRPTEGKVLRAKALAARAALYQQSRQAAAARKDLDEAIRLNVKNARLFDQRGALHLEQGRLAEAISDLYGATKLDINYGPAYLHRAQAYERQGDSLFAAEDYKTACRLGVPQACASAKKPTPDKAPPEPRGKQVVAAKAPAAPPPTKPAPAARPVNLQACRAALLACSEGDSALAACVEKAAACEDNPRTGCCPRACLQQFTAAVSEERSEAEVFREIFEDKGTCAQRPHAREE